jgi:hypothetical protein
MQCQSFWIFYIVSHFLSPLSLGDKKTRHLPGLSQPFLAICFTWLQADWLKSPQSLQNAEH